MAYLLDANTVINFLATGHATELAALAHEIDLCVVAEVKDEVDRRSAPGKRWWERSHIEVRPILPASPACETLLDLGLPSERGLGERASIALAHHDQALAFVTSDKNAMWIAFRELHGPHRRLMSLASFLHEARGRGLTWGVIDDAYRESKLPQPTWWASWRASSR